MKDKKLEVDPQKVKRILVETRALLWLLCRYRWHPDQFKHIRYEELFDINEMTRILFELDSLLNDFGIMVESEM